MRIESGEIIIDSQNLQGDLNQIDTMGKRKDSAIWNYFTKSVDGDSARCSLCLQILGIRSTSSNLNRHMKTKHRSIKLPPCRFYKEDEYNSSYKKQDDDDSEAPPAKKMFPKKLHEMAFVLPFSGTQRTIDKNDPLESNEEVIIQEIVHTDDADAYEVEEEELTGTFQENGEFHLEKIMKTNSSDDMGIGKVKIENVRRGKKNPQNKEFIQVLKNERLLKENAELRLLNKETQPKNLSALDNLDTVDLFFLSMSRTTKKLPKVDQSSIKLLLSDAVLKAELRHEQSLQNDAIELLSAPLPNDEVETRPTLLELAQLHN